MTTDRNGTFSGFLIDSFESSFAIYIAMVYSSWSSEISLIFRLPEAQ